MSSRDGNRFQVNCHRSGLLTIIGIQVIYPAYYDNNNDLDCGRNSFQAGFMGINRGQSLLYIYMDIFVETLAG